MMNVLRKRFDLYQISFSTIDAVPVPLGKVSLQEDRSLCLDMHSGASCGLGDDVLFFAGDESGVWHVKRQDFFDGEPWVYAVLFDDIRITLKGVIDDNGSFLYIHEDHLIYMDKRGKNDRICSVETLGKLLKCGEDRVLARD